MYNIYHIIAPVPVENSTGQTPLDIAEEKKYDECIELVRKPCRPVLMIPTHTFCALGWFWD